MKRNALLIGCLALPALAIGCSNAPTPTTAAPAADLSAAAVQEVKQLDAIESEAWAHRDLDKVVNGMAEDATGLYPGTEILKGKEAIKAFLKDSTFADPAFSPKCETKLVVASKSGDMVYSEGTCSGTATDAKTKKIVHYMGKTMDVYVKQADGTWKIAADVFTQTS